MIALVFVAIIASLVCLMSSMCAVSGGMSGGSRMGFVTFALVSFGVAIGSVLLIGKRNRKT